MPPFKQAILVGIDRDLPDFFKLQSRGYQARINAVLHSCVANREPGMDSTSLVTALSFGVSQRLKRLHKP